MTILLKTLAPAALLLGACTPTTAAQRGPDLILPPDGGIPVRGAGTGRECQNVGLDQFRGRQATSDLGAEMLRVSGAGNLRWVPHGSMITMEFSAERLTVHLDPSNRIERAVCG